MTSLIAHIIYSLFRFRHSGGTRSIWIPLFLGQPVSSQPSAGNVGYCDLDQAHGWSGHFLSVEYPGTQNGVYISVLGYGVGAHFALRTQHTGTATALFSIGLGLEDCFLHSLITMRSSHQSSTRLTDTVLTRFVWESWTLRNHWKRLYRQYHGETRKALHVYAAALQTIDCLVQSPVVLIANGQIWSHGPHTAECGSSNGHPPGVRGYRSSVYASNAIDSSGVSNPQS